jgi:hypothetical protein
MKTFKFAFEIIWPLKGYSILSFISYFNWAKPFSGGDFWPRAFTGKSLSEVLLFAKHGENMLCTKIVLTVRNNFCTHYVLPRFELGILMYWTCNSMNSLLSYYGLVDAKIRASDKDLQTIFSHFLPRFVHFKFPSFFWNSLYVMFLNFYWKHSEMAKTQKTNVIRF